MVRAASRLFFISVALLILAGAVAAGKADAALNPQTGVPIPAIVDFSSDAPALNYGDVEAGTAQVTLSWHTINMTDQTHLILETFYQNYWISLLGPNEGLPANGSKKITVALPQNFGVPTYRLTLATSANQVIEQQFLTIPYCLPRRQRPRSSRSRHLLRGWTPICSFRAIRTSSSTGRSKVASRIR